MQILPPRLPGLTFQYSLWLSLFFFFWLRGLDNHKFTKSQEERTEFFKFCTDGRGETFMDEATFIAALSQSAAALLPSVAPPNALVSVP